MAFNIDPKYNRPITLILGGIALAIITYFGLGDQLTSMVDHLLGIPDVPAVTPTVDTVTHSMLYLPFIQ